MADPIIPATPQQFSFGGRLLYGVVTSYDGFTEYRSASQKFPKRDGGIEEDMGRDQRRLEVRLTFIGPNCARDYESFASFVDGNRTALLVHPIAGKWTAFCKGFGHRIAFAEATNKIDVPVTFVESQLDAIIPADTPSVPVAAQNATDQQSAFKQTIALFIAKMAKAQTTVGGALDTIDSAIAQVSGTVASTVTSPIDFMTGQVDQALGAASSISGAVATIQAAADAFDESITAFSAAANDLFDGTSDTSTASPDQISTLLGVVQSNAEALEDALFAAPSTPAGCADAIADVEIMVDACMTLSDALAAELPPTTTYVNPVTQALLVMAQKIIDEWGLSYDALSYASAILGYNRIPNPAAVPAGMPVIVPTA